MYFVFINKITFEAGVIKLFNFGNFKISKNAL